MSLLVKSPILRQTAARSSLRVTRPAPIQARGVHIENTVYNNMPFEYRNKAAFGVKLALFLATGFSIPFLATWWQLRKAKSKA